MSKKKKVVFIGYYKIWYGWWEYYKRYSNDDYWFWNFDWDGSGKGVWCWGGCWTRDRSGHKDAVKISKLEMLIINGLESVKRIRKV